MEDNIKGQIIAGDFGKIIVRQKSTSAIEIGELLISEKANKKILMQVYDLAFGSQISQQNLELISGQTLEQDINFEFMDKNLRSYTIAFLKNILTIDNKKAYVSKMLPDFFSFVREITAEDLSFLVKPEFPLFIGNLRSGSKTIPIDIFLPGDKVFVEHILITASTGKGKSNLTKCILWDNIAKDYSGLLVLDPHDEYFGRNGLGLKDHPAKDNLVYYTPKSPPPGQMTLKININQIKPWHFNGVVYWTDAQNDAINSFFKKYRDSWISAILTDKEIEHSHEATIAVVKRKLMSVLNVSNANSALSSSGVFSFNSGNSTISDIISALESGKTVIIDTSGLSSQVEILVGSVISTELLSSYRYYKATGQLQKKPVVNIVIEEAPRVIGREILEKGQNIFSTIAREGRKFKIGLTAITQLPSLIPRQILANMNTKIILGMEMAPERQAVIDSASQDLSNDNRNIASLDKGEAIITSTFSKFALPVKIPLFKELAEKTQNNYIRQKYTNDLSDLS